MKKKFAAIAESTCLCLLIVGATFMATVYILNEDWTHTQFFAHPRNAVAPSPPSTTCALVRSCCLSCLTLKDSALQHQVRMLIIALDTIGINRVAKAIAAATATPMTTTTTTGTTTTPTPTLAAGTWWETTEGAKEEEEEGKQELEERAMVE